MTHEVSQEAKATPSPLCPSCNTPTLVWYTPTTQTPGQPTQIGGVSEIGYRCKECYLFVALPYSTGPIIAYTQKR